MDIRAGHTKTSTFRSLSLGPGSGLVLQRWATITSHAPATGAGTPDWPASAPLLSDVSLRARATAAVCWDSPEDAADCI